MKKTTNRYIFALIVAAIVLTGCTQISTTENDVVDALNKSEEQTSTSNNFREVFEIPSESERESLPDCSSVLYTDFPTDISKIYTITPLGNVDPPEHTIPTDHLYMHFHPGGTNTNTYDLIAPADVWVIHIISYFGSTLDPEDNVIYFAVCKDVIGYYNHVKELSPGMKKIVEEECGSDGVADNKNCFVQSFEPVKAGTYMGKIGRLQGNFDFGTIDLRTEHDFINKERYAKRTLHIQCPTDYYSSELKDRFLKLMPRSDGSCGKINYDIPGTLQGNWFYGNATEYYGGDWVKHAFFGYDNEKPDLAVISIGGVIVDEVDGLRWTFAPEISGIKNVRFENTAIESIYCYDKNSEDQFNIGPKGKIVMQLVSGSELKIEHQTGSCSGNEQFGVNAVVYGR